MGADPAPFTGNVRAATRSGPCPLAAARTMRYCDLCRNARLLGRAKQPDRAGACRTSARVRLYNELAAWWPLLSAPEEYAEEAQFVRAALVDACDATPLTVLELGSGGGNNAVHLKASFELTLVDVSEPMLDVSRGANPDCEHAAGDMRTVRLGRVFDAVFIHDAIMYMTSEDDLRRAIETAFVHCRDGGAAVFVPDFTRETFAPDTTHGGRDGEREALRYLIWAYDPDPSDSVYVEHFSILLRDAGGSVTLEHEQHLFGLFGRDVWKRLMAGAGFEPQRLRDTFGRDVFVGKKRGAS